MAEYWSIPQHGAGAGVLVLHAWWGLNDTFRRFCDRLAGEGFVALAPDLYNGAIATTREEARSLMRKMDKDAARKTLNTALKELAAHPAVNRPAVGVVGFSMGGYYALGLACKKPRQIAAVVAFNSTGGGKFEQAQASFLGHFAESDEFEPDRPEFDPAAAQLAWERTTAFLQEELMR